jgi:predicted Rossmann fold nucleotide-binding protein DprA/Smf involved in DNA uptake
MPGRSTISLRFVTLSFGGWDRDRQRDGTGIDGEAHRGALDAGGITVAVLGCGIDRDYPAVHGELARRICEHGLIVSEYQPGVEPAPWRFPAS